MLRVYVHQTCVVVQDKQRILEGCCELVPSLKHAQVVADWAGLRPARDRVRLELEYHQVAPPACQFCRWWICSWHSVSDPLCSFSAVLALVCVHKSVSPCPNMRCAVLHVYAFHCQEQEGVCINRWLLVVEAMTPPVVCWNFCFDLCGFTVPSAWLKLGKMCLQHLQVETTDSTDLLV